MAGIKFTVDVKKFARDMGRVGQRMATASSRVEVAVANQILLDTDQYVPARTISMANRTQADEKPLNVRAKEETKKELASGRGIVVYPGPYAHYLYVGKLFIDPDTGSSWAPKGATKVVTGKDLNISKAVHGKAQSHWFEASKAQNLPKWRNVAGKEMQREFRR